MFSWAHLSPYPKWDLNPLSIFCTAHGRMSIYSTMGRPFPLQNYQCKWGDLDPHRRHASLDPPNSASQMASWSFQPFLYSSWQRVPILYNGPPLSPSKLPIHMGDLDPMQYMVPWAHLSPQPKQYLHWFSNFCTTHDRNRHITLLSVTIGLLWSIAMQPNNVITIYFSYWPWQLEHSENQPLLESNALLWRQPVSCQHHTLQSLEECLFCTDNHVPICLVRHSRRPLLSLNSSYTALKANKQLQHSPL